MSDKRSLPTTRLVLLLVTLLGACDGGLFGTDDGTDAGPPIATAPPGTGIDIAETTAPGSTADAPDDSPDSDLAGDDTSDDIGDFGVSTDGDIIGAGSEEAASPSSPVTDEAAPSSLAPDSPAPSAAAPVVFDNTQITTPRNDALLTVVNPRDTEVFLSTGGINATQANEVPVPAGTASMHLALPVGVTDVRLIDEAAIDSEAGPYSLEMNLGTGTVTTLVARDNEGQLDAVPLITESGSSDTTLARVRLVQAVALGDAQLSADFSLASRGSGGGGVDTNFVGMSFDSPDSGYQEVPAGDYTLSDSVGRVPSQDVSFKGGQAYTLIIRAESGNVLQLEVDSDLDVR